jgi:hypothetical protein
MDSALTRDMRAGGSGARLVAATAREGRGARQEPILPLAGDREATWWLGIKGDRHDMEWHGHDYGYTGGGCIF